MRLVRACVGGLVPAAMSILACSDSLTDGEPEVPDAIEAVDVAAKYLATNTSLGPFGVLRFTSVNDGMTVDWIERGALLQIELLLNGTTTGQLFLLGGAADGSDLRESLAGTWSIVDGRVRFFQSADTFVRDISFQVAEKRLMADTTIAGTRFEIVLRRDGPFSGIRTSLRSP